MDFTKIRSIWWSGTCYHLEQLQAIISSNDVESYAYILHDKDKKDDNPNELKKPHYHFLVHFYTNQRGTWFKMFASDDMGIVFAQPTNTPKSAYDYLIHDTPIARKQKKYLYKETDRTSTIDNFETEDKVDENVELYEDLLQLLNGEMTWHELIRKKPKRIHMIANIKVAYDMLFYETYGYRYFEKDNIRVNPRTGEVIRPQKQPPQKPYSPSPTPQPQKPTTHHADLIPIDNDENLPF